MGFFRKLLRRSAAPTSPAPAVVEPAADPAESADPAEAAEAASRATTLPLPDDELPPAALVDTARCPLLVFTGAEDGELRAFGVDPSDPAPYADRGLQSIVVPDVDHIGVLLSLDRVLPPVVEWLLHSGELR